MPKLLSLLLSLLLLTLAVPAVYAQATAPTALPVYGTAEVYPSLSGWLLALADGVTPNQRYKTMEENGKNKLFADEAAVLNYLYGQGWDVLPNGTTSTGNVRRYLLKRRTQ